MGNAGCAISVAQPALSFCTNKSPLSLANPLFLAIIPAFSPINSRFTKIFIRPCVAISV